MGAAEDEDVPPGTPERPQVDGGHPAGHRVRPPALLDQRHQERAGLGDDLRPGRQPPRRLLIGAARDRRLRADEADDPGARGPDRRPHGRLHDADHRDLQRRLQGGERERGGGVAGDDQQLDAARLQEPADFDREARHRLPGFGAVRHARGVAEVQQTLLRHRLAQSPQDGQTADAGIEDPDGLGGTQSGPARPARNPHRASSVLQPFRRLYSTTPA